MATSSPAPTIAPSEEPPDRDLIDLARRFRGLAVDSPREARSEPFDYSVGDRETFDVLDLDVPERKQVTATVRHITEHAYFFVADGVQASQSTLARIGGDFESKVYPAVRAAFGSEWSPGVDGDTRITLLHAPLGGVGGYFGSSDEYPSTVAPYSNEREMLYIDSGYLQSPGAGYNALVAHELQHMIDWHADPEEEGWVNEGLSQVAAELLGGGGVEAFLTSPDTQLNAWPALADSGRHYAASELFFRYLLDRHGGRENAKELLAAQGDGIDGVDEYLEPFDTSFRDVFADWVVANYVDAADGKYVHEGIDARTRIKTTVNAAGEGQGTVHQFAADYLEIKASSQASFSFDGGDEVSMGVPPLAGAFWWSNQGDGIDSRLTREFDLSDVSKATLRFMTWYDIEEGWDYAYVAASTDGGKTWKALPGRHTTTDDPVGASYGPGYTGNSDGWVQEEIDLTAYAGRQILLRFEYVTDDASTLTGFAVDNIAIAELAYRYDTEDIGEWTAEGFRQITGPLPQRFLVQLIEANDPARVTTVELDSKNRATVAVDGSSTIVIAAVTEGTTEVASYDWSLSAP